MDKGFSIVDLDENEISVTDDQQPTWDFSYRGRRDVIDRFQHNLRDRFQHNLRLHESIKSYDRKCRHRLLENTIQVSDFTRSCRSKPTWYFSFVGRRDRFQWQDFREARDRGNGGQPLCAPAGASTNRLGRRDVMDRFKTPFSFGLFDKNLDGKPRPPRPASQQVRLGIR